MTLEVLWQRFELFLKIILNIPSPFDGLSSIPETSVLMKSSAASKVLRALTFKIRSMSNPLRPRK